MDIPEGETARKFLTLTVILNIIDGVGGGKLINNAESYGIWTGSEGNKSVMTIEDGVGVFTVVPNDTPDPNPVNF